MAAAKSFHLGSFGKLLASHTSLFTDHLPLSPTSGKSGRGDRNQTQYCPTSSCHRGAPCILIDATLPEDESFGPFHLAVFLGLVGMKKHQYRANLHIFMHAV